MTLNPFLRGYDKLSIQLLVQDLQPGGSLQALSYVIHAMDRNHTLVLSVQPTLEQAQQIVERLTFATGHFSRCWEISTAHLPETVVDNLFSLAYADKPLHLRELHIEFFEMSGHSVVGCKLRNTPWTEDNLELFSTRPADLRQRQLHYGLPVEFVDILHLAGQANVRFLLLDPDAPTLAGLPCFANMA
ncbi:hypothetical protein [Pseudomonas sp. HS-18]|uniref:DUF5983 family protein n=1 Tax=Pseudomonas sp. HS-18 TaxID=2879114 RepID=UPI001CF06674|nr:hypothetical protein [Pseudomonas sp. HS-18]UCL88080.1 hypothetical protein LDJ84_05120 [Pseudomonas sp. HS-18]